MPLTILRHKEWNVWNSENREIVLRDERLHKEEEDTMIDYQRRTNLEKRREILRQRALKDHPPPALPASEAAPPPALPAASKPATAALGAPAARAPVADVQHALQMVPVAPPAPARAALEITEVEMRPFSLMSGGHINLFPTDNDFESVLGKEKPKRERETLQFKKLQLPTNKEYEADKNKEEQETLRREGVAPLGLGDYDQRLKATPWDGKKTDHRGIELDANKLERLRKRDEKQKVFSDPLSAVEKHFQEVKEVEKHNGPFISNEIQRMHMRHQIDDIRPPKRHHSHHHAEESDDSKRKAAAKEAPRGGDAVIERLRKERLAREERERSRTLRLLTGR